MFHIHMGKKEIIIESRKHSTGIDVGDVLLFIGIAAAIFIGPF